MKKTILLFLILTLILGIFSSCGYKTTDPIDDETSGSTSEETTVASVETSAVTTETSASVSDSVNTEDTANATGNGDATSDSTDTQISVDTKVSEYVESYTIEKIDGQYYMVFNSYTVDPSYGGFFTRTAFGFNSVEEYFQTLVDKTFSLDDLVHMARHFSRDEHGIPIFDPNDFYIPLFLEGWEKSTNTDIPPVMVQDSQKIYFIAQKGDNGFMYAELMTQKAFELRLNAETEELELIRNDQRELRVKTEPYLNGQQTLYTVYVTEGNHYCCYSIRVGNEEHLTQDDLLSLGLVKYE